MFYILFALHDICQHLELLVRIWNFARSIGLKRVLLTTLPVAFALYQWLSNKICTTCNGHLYHISKAVSASKSLTWHVYDRDEQTEIMNMKISNQHTEDIKLKCDYFTRHTADLVQLVFAKRLGGYFVFTHWFQQHEGATRAGVRLNNIIIDLK